MNEKLHTIRLIFSPGECRRELDAIGTCERGGLNAAQCCKRKQRLTRLERILRIQKKMVNAGGFSALLLAIPLFLQWLADRGESWSPLPQVFFCFFFAFLLTGAVVYGWNAAIRWTEKFEARLEKAEKVANGAKNTETVAHTSTAATGTAPPSSERTLLMQIMAGIGSREGRWSLAAVLITITIATVLFHLMEAAFTATPPMEHSVSNITTPAFLLRAAIALLPLLIIAVFVVKAVWHFVQEGRHVWHS
ncbi:MAG: hypothetical protein ACFN9G_01320 [Cardiobacterium sp.]